ncbi:CheY-like chemotaxis protein [Flavobacterium sp. 270]|uniref:response regulator n=1 Tax=Flavobacterium sp. 270 TaxID=2512114 RepID=UPI001064B12B|nr:response regulator [Flavobacterium sp. 270]TDW51658.1 CheY-like chemotaxis protein [Flavobacterium sp. 270]
MSKSGPIVLLEDDHDDRIFMETIFSELGIENERVYLKNSDEALEFLHNTSKSLFLIFCDVNLRGKNGLELKREIDNHKQLRLKSIPFVFYSTSIRQEQVIEAYTELTVQGFFKKENDLSEAKTSIATIIAYWKLCRHPNM